MDTVKIKAYAPCHWCKYSNKVVVGKLFRTKKGALNDSPNYKIVELEGEFCLPPEVNYSI